jgi:hypothetical protein
MLPAIPGKASSFARRQCSLAVSTPLAIRLWSLGDRVRLTRAGASHYSTRRYISRNTLDRKTDGQPRVGRNAARSMSVAESMS